MPAYTAAATAGDGTLRFPSGTSDQAPGVLAPRGGPARAPSARSRGRSSPAWPRPMPVSSSDPRPSARHAPLPEIRTAPGAGSSGSPRRLRTARVTARSACLTLDIVAVAPTARRTDRRVAYGHPFLVALAAVRWGHNALVKWATTTMVMMGSDLLVLATARWDRRTTVTGKAIASWAEPRPCGHGPNHRNV